MKNTRPWLLIIVIGLLLINSTYSKRTVTATTLGYTLYSDPYKGYEVAIPEHMKVDDSLQAIRTLFKDNQTQIEIYQDSFYNTVHNAAKYINYSNQFLENNNDHVVTYDKNSTIAGKPAHITKWHRNKLKHVTNDKHYYVSAEIINNNYEVFTILIKSSKPIDNEVKILQSFKITQPNGRQLELPSSYIKTSNTKWNQATEDVYNHYFSKESPLTWGIFEPSAPDNMDSLHRIEEQISFSFPFIVRYQSLDKFKFPYSQLENAYDEGKLVELTLQTYFYKQDNAGILYKILDGEFDQEIEEYAKDIKSFGHPILFRLNNEMNGDWCAYSSYHHSKDTEIYKEVWKYFYETFKQHQVDNVLWVWNPNHHSKPGFAWNDSIMYYPGDEYVDIVGLTAYNTGTYYEGETWNNFYELYEPLYKQSTRISEKPLMITEFGSSSHGGDKIEWIQNMFAHINQFPEVKVAIWWNSIDWDSNKQPARIYRLDESEKMLGLFKQHLQKYK